MVSSCFFTESVLTPGWTFLSACLLSLFLSIYMSLCLYLSMCVHAHAHMLGSGAETHVEYLPQLLSTFFFETKSLTGPGAHWLNCLDWSAAHPIFALQANFYKYTLCVSSFFLCTEHLTCVFMITQPTLKLSPKPQDKRTLSSF